MSNDYHHDTSRSLPIALLRARERVMVPVRVMLAALGVTEQQWRVLRVLEEKGPMGLTALADRASLLLPSLTRIIHGLEERTFVERLVVASDRRCQQISVTSAGTALVRDNLGQAREIADLLRARLGAVRHDQLLDLLNAVEGTDFG